MGRIISGIFSGIAHMFGMLIGAIFGGVFGWIGKILVPVIIVLALIWGVTNPLFFQGVFNLFSGGSLHVVTTPAVINQIRSMNTLVTTSYNTSITSEVKKEAAFNWLPSERVVLRVEGTILAGIDLSRIREQDVTISGGTVTVRVPPAYIVSKDLHSTQLVTDQGLLSGIDPTLLAIAEQKGRDELLLAACNHGILANAEREAQIALGDLLSTLAGVQSLQLIQDAPQPGDMTGCP